MYTRLFCFYSLGFLFSSLSSIVHAAINDPCDAGGIPGICVTTSTCAFSDGTSRTGFCPNDDSDVKCCTTKCGPGAAGICRFNSTCESGRTLTGLCPGPNDFKCCLPATDSEPSLSSSIAGNASSTSSASSFSLISTFSGVFSSSSLPGISTLYVRRKDLIS
ncbi:hypothetical protein BKA70DRAFT_1110062 [Coprinopsis sp. MPI-PUGE-AT-0042]|nr:hypothetical protein BKA70DRAFT_1110062 [Coprinopsis sp. MPI-PUGE-AT-0042]